MIPPAAVDCKLWSGGFVATAVGHDSVIRNSVTDVGHGGPEHTETTLQETPVLLSSFGISKQMVSVFSVTPWLGFVSEDRYDRRLRDVDQARRKHAQVEHADQRNDQGG